MAEYSRRGGSDAKIEIAEIFYVARPDTDLPFLRSCGVVEQYTCYFFFRDRAPPSLAPWAVVVCAGPHRVV